MNLIKYCTHELMEGVTLFGHPLFYAFIIVLIASSSLPTAITLGFMFISLELVSAALKILFPKERPVPRKKKSLLERYDAGSFPSIHAARITALSVVSFVVLPDYVQLFLIAAMPIVAISRIYLKEHDVKDVVAGIFLGVIVAIVWIVLQNTAL